MMNYNLSQKQIDTLNNFYDSEESQKLKIYSIDEIVNKINSFKPINAGRRLIWNFKRTKGIELNMETNEWKFHGGGFH